MPNNDPAHSSQDPDPASNPAVAASPGPGETPPDAGSMSGAAGDARREAPNMGPVSGNRTPMIVTLVVLGLMVLAVAIITGASFLPSD